MTSTLWASHTFTLVLEQPGETITPFLSYLPDLSRVRVDEAVAAEVPVGAALNANTGAEVDLTGWFQVGGAMARSTAFAHEGVASAEFTPDGVTAITAIGIDAGAPAAPDTEYQQTCWVYLPTGYSQVRPRLQWLDGANAIISIQEGPLTNVPAGVWTFLTVTGIAPALTAKAVPTVAMHGTPPASAVLYVDDLRVTDDVHSAGPVPAGATRIVERSTDLVNWATVRGGASKLVDGAAIPLNDWEFTSNAENHYRVRVLVEGELYWTWRDSISVVLDQVWLKPIRRPFLSRPVTMTEHGDVERAGRSGVFPIAGRGLPVAVVDLHESQRWTLELMTIGQPAAAELDLIVSSGDVFFVHGPPECPIVEGYYVAGDLKRARRSTRGNRRYHTLPLTMVAGPAAELEGTTFTWRSALNTWATWADVAATGLTWRQIDDLIGTAEDVVVS